MPHNVPGADSEVVYTDQIAAIGQEPFDPIQNVIIRNDVNPHSLIRESVGGVQQQDVSEVPVQSQVLADGVHQSEGNGDDIQNVALPADMLGGQNSVGQNSADMLDQNLNDVRSEEVSQEYEVSEYQEVGSSRDQVQPDFESHRVLSLPSLPKNRRAVHVFIMVFLGSRFNSRGNIRDSCY
ncbi:hypothetical protein V6N12_028485 [Hibiscus sabdariffa]|uniref:Uncharacterized protein n=1 Tax=Hibiscus sabdariffa TaxID=183260 RepID=A0ABR2F5Z2_9ROSI